MTFEEKWNYFNRYAKFDTDLAWVQTTLSFIKKNPSAGRIDFSFKNVKDNIYFQRLNIGPIKDHQKSYFEECYKNILTLGKYWKLSWADEDVLSFFKHLDWSICDSFHYGFDLRANMKESRLKIWCGFKADKETIQKLTAYCPFEKNILSPYWKKYNPQLILIGWVYGGNGTVSWRIYPEVPSKNFVLESTHPVVQKLGPFAGKVLSSWPSKQPHIYWDKLTHKEEFLKALKPLLYSDRAMPLTDEFQKHGLELSIISTLLPSSNETKIPETTFYFI